MKRKPYIKPTLTTIPLEGAETICIGSTSGGHQEWHVQIGGGNSEESIFGGDTEGSGGSGSGSAPDAGSDGTIWID